MGRTGPAQLQASISLEHTLIAELVEQSGFTRVKDVGSLVDRGVWRAIRGLERTKMVIVWERHQLRACGLGKCQQRAPAVFKSSCASLP